MQMKRKIYAYRYTCMVILKQKFHIRQLKKDVLQKVKEFGNGTCGSNIMKINLELKSLTFFYVNKLNIENAAFNNLHSFLIIILNFGIHYQ